MPTLIEANRAFCGEFQIKVDMPARSALRLPCRRRHGNRFQLRAGLGRHEWLRARALGFHAFRAAVVALAVANLLRV
jgi:hypothetical protein